MRPQRGRLFVFTFTTMAFSQSLNVACARGRTEFAITQGLLLPPLIARAEQVYTFVVDNSLPNFVTQKTVIGRPLLLSAEVNDLTGRVIAMPSADPGYDWIFSHSIAGFITMYGGANSHMAIRACELSIPAVIGAGNSLFNKWASAELLEIDCLNNHVRILQ
jgi:glutamine kinase